MKDDLRSELIQVAATAMAMVSLIDKQSTHLAFDVFDDRQFDFDYTRIEKDVSIERLAQERKWGVRYIGNEGDRDFFFWLSILGEEVGEAHKAELEADMVRRETQ